MRNLTPCKQDTSSIDRLRSDQLTRFSNYVEKQRRCNARYYDLLCKLKIDLITFSLYLGPKKSGIHDESQLEPLRNDLISRSTAPFRHRMNFKYKYDESDTYYFQYGTKQYELNIAKANWEKFKPYLVTVHDPTPEVLIYFEQYLSGVTDYHVKAIEFTYDFFTEDKETVWKFIKQHTIVKWRGREFHSDYETTFYGNSIRFATGKGLRSYHKEEEQEGCLEQFIRLEMQLKREILKNNGVHNIEDIFNMDSRLVNKYFNFKYYNFNKLTDRMLEKNGWEDRLDGVSNNIRNEIEKGYLYEMNKDSLDWCKRYQSDSYLKDCKYWDHFISRFRHSSFLNGDSFLLSSSLMVDDL